MLTAKIFFHCIAHTLKTHISCVYRKYILPSKRKDFSWLPNLTLCRKDVCDRRLRQRSHLIHNLGVWLAAALGLRCVFEKLRLRSEERKEGGEEAKGQRGARRHFVSLFTYLRKGKIYFFDTSN